MIHTTMSLELKYRLDDLYALFAGRCPPQREPKEPREDLKLRKTDVLESMLRGMDRVVSEYDRIHKGDSRNGFRKGRAAEQEFRVYHIVPISKNPLVSYAITKKFFKVTEAGVEFYPQRKLGEEFESVSFDLFQDTPDTEDQIDLWEKIGRAEIATFRMNHRENEWNLADRFIEEKYRQQGIASLLLLSAETFVQTYAKKTRIPQKIVINIGQPSVLLMFLNKGYKAQTEEDQQKIDKILRGDETLEFDYSLVQSRNEDGSLGEWTKNIWKDVYCFERGVLPKTELNAFRITLEKTFSPSRTEVDDGSDKVKAAINSLL